MKKALNIIKSILVWTVVAFAVFMMVFTVFSVNMFDRNDRNVFGHKIYIVNSDSMAKTHFSAGDLIFVKEVDASTLKEGDVISFISQNKDSFGKIYTHMIRSKTYDANGKPGFVTYGTTTGTNDSVVVTYPYVMGKYVGHIDGVGNFFNFLKSTTGYIVCIFVPFMLLIIYHGVKTISLFRKYKKEQTEELEIEKAAISAEREENKKLLEELKALRAEMNNITSSNHTQTVEEVENNTEVSDNENNG